MRVYDPAEPLISIHVPKCGGTSFYRALRGWFGWSLKKHYHDELSDRPPKRHRLRPLLFPSRLKSGMCIHGHFNWKRGNGADKWYPEVNQFLSLVRDPFELHLSTYFYVRREATEGKGGAFRSGQAHEIVGEDWTLEEYLRESRQSYMMSFFPDDITIDNFRDVLEERYVFIGVTERLQESANVIAAKLGRAETTIPHRNVSSRTEEVPPGARDEFRAENELAFSVYDFATKKLDEALS